MRTDRRKGRCICDSMHPCAQSGIVGKSANFQATEVVLVLVLLCYFELICDKPTLE